MPARVARAAYDAGMSRFTPGYSVGRPTGQCQATGRALEPGETYIATLCDDEQTDGFIRVDVSEDAWDSGHRPERLFSYWKTTVARPDERRQLFVDDEVLMSIFEQLADDERPQRQAFRFVLALVLMRKRLLRYVDRVGTGEDERWRFRLPGQDPDAPLLEVRNPHLTDDDVRELTDQLSEILQGEL